MWSVSRPIYALAPVSVLLVLAIASCATSPLAPGSEYATLDTNATKPNIVRASLIPPQCSCRCTASLHRCCASPLAHLPMQHTCGSRHIFFAWLHKSHCQDLSLSPRCHPSICYPSVYHRQVFLLTDDQDLVLGSMAPDGPCQKILSLLVEKVQPTYLLFSWVSAHHLSARACRPFGALPAFATQLWLARVMLCRHSQDSGRPAPMCLCTERGWVGGLSLVSCSQFLSSTILSSTMPFTSTFGRRSWPLRTQHLIRLTRARCWAFYRAPTSTTPLQTRPFVAPLAPSCSRDATCITPRYAVAQSLGISVCGSEMCSDYCIRLDH